MMQDPVCGMEVDEGSPFALNWQGREYRFCSERCRERFQASPGRYAGVSSLLSPVFGLLLSPIIAAAAMSFSSVSVVANALRLRRVEL